MAKCMESEQKTTQKSCLESEHWQQLMSKNRKESGNLPPSHLLFNFGQEWVGNVCALQEMDGTCKVLHQQQKM